MKKGKQERYVKDDTELNSYLLQTALEGAGLHVTAEAPAITGITLENLAKQFLAVMATIDRLSRRYHAAVLEKLIYLPAIKIEQMRDKASTESVFSQLIDRLNAEDTSGVRYELAIEEDVEHSSWKARINAVTHNVGNERVLAGDFFTSGEYASMVALGEQLRDLLGEGAYVQRGERKAEVASFRAAGIQIPFPQRDIHVKSDVRVKSLGT